MMKGVLKSVEQICWLLAELKGKNLNEFYWLLDYLLTEGDKIPASQSQSLSASQAMSKIIAEKIRRFWFAKDVTFIAEQKGKGLLMAAPALYDEKFANNYAKFIGDIELPPADETVAGAADGMPRNGSDRQRFSVVLTSVQTGRRGVVPPVAAGATVPPSPLSEIAKKDSPPVAYEGGAAGANAAPPPPPSSRVVADVVSGNRVAEVAPRVASEGEVAVSNAAPPPPPSGSVPRPPAGGLMGALVSLVSPKPQELRKMEAAFTKLTEYVNSIKANIEASKTTVKESLDEICHILQSIDQQKLEQKQTWLTKIDSLKANPDMITVADFSTLTAYIAEIQQKRLLDDDAIGNLNSIILSIKMVVTVSIVNYKEELRTGEPKDRDSRVREGKLRVLRENPLPENRELNFEQRVAELGVDVESFRRNYQLKDEMRGKYVQLIGNIRAAGSAAAAVPPPAPAASTRNQAADLATQAKERRRAVRQQQGSSRDLNAAGAGSPAVAAAPADDPKAKLRPSVVAKNGAGSAGVEQQGVAGQEGQRMAQLRSPGARSGAPAQAPAVAGVGAAGSPQVRMVQLHPVGARSADESALPSRSGLPKKPLPPLPGAQGVVPTATQVGMYPVARDGVVNGGAPAGASATPAPANGAPPPAK